MKSNWPYSFHRDPRYHVFNFYSYLFLFTEADHYLIDRIRKSFYHLLTP